MDQYGFTDPAIRPRLSCGAIRTPGRPASFESTQCSLSVSECAAIAYGRNAPAKPKRKGRK